MEYNTISYTLEYTVQYSHGLHSIMVPLYHSYYTTSTGILHPSLQWSHHCLLLCMLWQYNYPPAYCTSLLTFLKNTPIVHTTLVSQWSTTVQSRIAKLLPSQFHLWWCWKKRSGYLSYQSHHRLQKRQSACSVLHGTHVMLYWEVATFLTDEVSQYWQMHPEVSD